MNLYDEITRRIIEQLEQGIIPWQKPWIGSSSAISHVTGKPYSLLNQILLGRAGEYATYQQVQAAGGYVRRGEKAHMVVFWKWLEKEGEETGEVKEVPFLRYYNVFHIDQCEGLKAKHSKPLPQNAEADQKAESIICGYLKSSGVRMTHQQGDKAISFTQSWLQMYGDELKAIICDNDDMSSAVKAYLITEGREDIVCIGVDGNAGPMQMVADGELDATVFQDGAGQIRKAIEVSVDILEGKEIEKEYMIPFVLITLDNVNDYI